MQVSDPLQTPILPQLCLQPQLLEQSRSPEQVRSPLHSTSHLPLPQRMLAEQALLPEQCTAMPWVSGVASIVPVHEVGPEQRTSQSPPPQRIRPVQEPSPLQKTLQCVLSPQSRGCEHEKSPVQRKTQRIPLGQTLAGHSALLQLIVHSFALQLLHCEGHGAAPSMGRPASTGALLLSPSTVLSSPTAASGGSTPPSPTPGRVPTVRTQPLLAAPSETRRTNATCVVARRRCDTTARL